METATAFEYQCTHTFDRHAITAMLSRGSSSQDTAVTNMWDPPQDPVHPDPSPHPDEVLADDLDARALRETSRGNFAGAQALHEQAVELRRQLHGEADPALPQSLTYLGNLALRQGHVDQAQWLHTQAFSLVVKTRGEDNLQCAVILHNLATTARRAGDTATATTHYERALAIKVNHLGWAHHSVALTLNNLGNLARSQGDLQLAMVYFARAREIFEKTTGGNNAGLAAALMGLGRVHLRYGMHVSATFMFERAVRIRESIEEVTPVQLAGSRMLMALALAPSQPDEARKILHRAMKDYDRAGAPRPDCTHALRSLAKSLAATAE